MPTTVNRGYDTPITGTDVDTWGDVLNANAALVDTNLGGVSSVALTNTNVVLNNTQYANGTIVFTGTLTGNVQITFPSVQGWWSVDNQTTGNFVITLTTSAGAVIGIPPGEQVEIQVNATSGIKFRNLGRIGSYLRLAATAVPAWITACTVPPFLNCNGGSFSAVTYPVLAAMLGGTTLPDSRGRSAAALNQGTGRLSASFGVNGDVLFSGGGSDNFSIAQSNLPNVDLPVTGGSVSLANNPGFGFGTLIISNTLSNTTTVVVPSGSPLAVGYNNPSVRTGGSGTALSQVQPTYVDGITMIRAG